MNRRTASLLVLVVFALLTSFHLLNQPASAQATGKRISSRQKAVDPPSTHIGFLSATQVPAGGGTYSPFPAVMGDFNGDGKQDVATIVNTNTNGVPKLSISVLLSNGDGTFTNKLTATPYATVVFNPIWVGDLDGTNGDDVIVGVQATASTPASIDVWLGNGDGTFTFKGNTAVTSTNDVMVWATLTKHAGTGPLDFVAADAASPNGSIWTLTGNGDGTFNAATSVAFTGALAAGDPVNANSFSPMVFADFDGANGLDFAAPAATTNQIAVYLNTGSAYTGPTLLTTPNHLYHSCYLGAGVLSGNLDLVAANCYDNKLTVWTNNGSGAFSAGTYYPAGAGVYAGVVPSAVTVTDIDGDGNNDVVSSNWQGADVTVLLGDGTGTLSAPGLGYAIGGGAHINAALTPALVADFNGDGHPDLILQDSEVSLVYLQSFGTATPSFRSAVNYSVPLVDLSYSFGIATGDFNGDKIPDFVVGNGDETPGTTTGGTVFLSNADGSLQPGVALPATALTNPQLRYVAVADFDGDGNLDIAATDTTNGVVQIFAGDGAGNFTAGPSFSTGTGVSALGIAVGDFNGDKKLDLAVVNNAGTSSANVAILTNTSTPGSFVFTAAQLPNLSTLATEITVADVNNDGKLDLVVPLWGTDVTPGTKVAVFLGNGSGAFTAKPDFDLGTLLKNPYDAAVGDFNGDGKVDLAVTVEDQTAGHNQGIAVALGNGDGTFQTATLLLATTKSPGLDTPSPGYVKAVDLDRDGKLDLLYTNKKFGTVAIKYGKGDGTFYDAVEYPSGAKAYGVALADINGDGALDVVTSANARDFVGVTVLLNTSGDTTVQDPPSANNVTAGTPVTFSATVTGSKVLGVTAVPTGTVSFLDGSTVLGSGTLSGGKASYTNSTLTAGSHNITARYDGDVNYLVSTSAAVVETLLPQPDYSLAVDQTEKDVNPGSSAVYTITLTPTNGYNGTVTYSCGKLPPGAACGFATSGNTTTLTITTQGPTASLSSPRMMRQQPGTENLWASLGGLGFVGIVLAGDWKKRNRRRLAIVFGILALVMILALAGCGGGSSSGGGGGGGGGGTPVGTYPVTVTAVGTAGTNHGNTAPHLLNLTLKVL